MSRTNGERTILVSGATGQQGGAVARHLLDGGFAVRALTRSPSSPGAKALEELGAEIVQGSFGDPASLARALDRVQGAYSVQTFLEEGPQGEAAQGRAFAEAAAEAGVEHFVYSSVGGAERDTGIPHFDSKWAVEQRIRELGLPATILRPVFFMDNWGAMMREPILAGQLPQPLGPDTPLQQIDVDDIGVFAAMAFENPESWIGREVELAGDGLTMTETAEAFGEALGRAVQYVQVPWDAFAAQRRPARSSRSCTAGSRRRGTKQTSRDSVGSIRGSRASRRSWRRRTGWSSEGAWSAQGLRRQRHANCDPRSGLFDRAGRATPAKADGSHRRGPRAGPGPLVS